MDIPKETPELDTSTLNLDLSNPHQSSPLPLEGTERKFMTHRGNMGIGQGEGTPPISPSTSTSNTMASTPSCHLVGDASSPKAHRVLAIFSRLNNPIVGK